MEAPKALRKPAYDTVQVCTSGQESLARTHGRFQTAAPERHCIKIQANHDPLSTL